MRLFLLFLFTFSLSTVLAQDKAFPSIIPQPVQIKTKTGQFTLPQTITIYASANAAKATTYLKTKLGKATGAAILSKKSTDATFNITLNKTTDTLIGQEGYRLSVTPKKVLIRANTAAGLFYGVQTFLQLMPDAIESKTLVKNKKWTAPCTEITDYPRFKWRGLLFDVARHFFTKGEVKQYIDNMVKYKYNILHLHLTDNEGWRIQIKSLPRLTEVGAWNVKKVGYFGTFSKPTPDEPRNYGGFYTHEDIKELVQYAKDRFVNIMPEIDVPGHSLAAVVAYPSLSCTPEANTYSVRSGEPITRWEGPNYFTIVDNTLCPANENVYEFLDKVITEVAQLFPFEYIHMGGDECAKNFWEKSDAVKALMQREGLKDMHEVQSYFEKRVEKIVESKGKKFVGWEEILEGGISPNATLMSWRSIKAGLTAAKLKHEVIMSPTAFSYIDLMQGDPIIEPKMYASLRLSKAYQFDPVPDSVDAESAKFIKGGQANLWTEQVYNMRHAEYMTWPRGFAIAESLWSPKTNKNWNNFVHRVENHFDRLHFAKVNFAPSLYDPAFTSEIAADSVLKVTMTTEIQGLSIHYTFDNSFPDQFYPIYKDQLTVPKDAVMLKAVTYRGDKQVGRMIYMPIEELRKRLRK